MRSHKSDTGLLHGWIRPIGFGALIGALGCVLMLLLMAALLLKRDFPQGSVAPMASVAAVFGAFAGGFTAGRMAGERGWLMGLAAGILLFVMLLIAGGFSMLNSAGATLTRLAMMAAAAAVGGIVSVNTRRRR